MSVFDALILLETCPKRAFQERWSEILKQWLCQSRRRTSVLIVMSRSDNHDWLHEYLSSTSCSVLSRDLDVMLLNTGLKYYVSVIIVESDDDGGRDLVKSWNDGDDASPSFVSIRGCKVKFSY